jgi:hypothetical protein
VAEEHERWPELDAERAPEALAAGVGDLEVPNLGMLGECVGEQWLRGSAVAAPGAAEFHHRRPGQRVELGARRFLVGV